MKGLIATAFLLTTPLHAETVDPGRSLLDEFCAKQGEIAHGVMELRQMGVPQSKIREALFKGRETDPVMASIIVAAYEHPRFSTEEYQIRAAQDFGVDIESDCYATVGK